MTNWIRNAIKGLKERALRQSKLEKHERAMLRHKETEYAEEPSDYEVVFRTAEFIVEKAIIDLNSEMKWVKELASRHPEEMIKNKDLALKVAAEAIRLSQGLKLIFLADEKRTNMKPEKRHEAR